jgi:hypothetical protein
MNKVLANEASNSIIISEKLNLVSIQLEQLPETAILNLENDYGGNNPNINLS